MKRTNVGWFVFVFGVALLAMIGCSKDDIIDQLPADEVVEAGLDSAIQDTVVPVVSFMGFVGDQLTARNFGVVLICPDTSGWCSSGTATCSVNANLTSYDFDFDECQAVTGDEPLLLDGNVNAAPTGLSSVALTLTNLFINNEGPVSGTGSIDGNNCTYNINMSTDNAGISGVYVQCDADNYPTGNTITISFGDFSVFVNFNGTNTAPATAYQGKTLAASCAINLDSLTSSCDLP